jgi:hypothetical protein
MTSGLSETFPIFREGAISQARSNLKLSRRHYAVSKYVTGRRLGDDLSRSYLKNEGFKRSIFFSDFLVCSRK